MNIQPQFEHRIRPELLPVLNETEAGFESGSTTEAFSDDSLLDGYSRTISTVVNRVAPSVVNIRVEGRGGGSGFIIARDGFILTKVNVDDEPALMQRFGIRGIPALLFLSGGELRKQIAGAVGKKVIVEQLKAVATPAAVY